MQTVALLSITADELRSIVADAVRETIAGQIPPVIETKPDADEFLTREETARELRVAKMTLRSYELRGILKPQRIGRRVLYSRREILAALAGESPAGSSTIRSASSGRSGAQRQSNVNPTSIQRQSHVTKSP